MKIRLLVKKVYELCSKCPQLLLLEAKGFKIRFMKVVFFEVASWEKERLQKAFPQATLTSEKLTPTNASSYSEAEIISTFIYSLLNKETLFLLPNLKFIAT